MQYVLSKFKLRPDAVESAKKFLAEINHKQKEMAEVLSDAAMSLDCSFVDTTPEGSFLFVFKRIEDHEKLRKEMANSKLGIYDSIREWAAKSIEGEGQELRALAVFEAL